MIGDYASGKIFIYNLDTLTDNGQPKRWLRSWRALPQPSEATVRFDSLRVDMQTGVAVVGNPTASLRWSDDAGNSWSGPMVEGVGVEGATATRVMFRRMGSTRQESGLDRVLELSATNTVSDAFPAVLIGAELDATP
jgi:hypothetical protein